MRTHRRVNEVFNYQDRCRFPAFPLRYAAQATKHRSLLSHFATY